jgi:hypothetical protein
LEDALEISSQKRELTPDFVRGIEDLFGEMGEKEPQQILRKLRGARLPW